MSQAKKQQTKQQHDYSFDPGWLVDTRRQLERKHSTEYIHALSKRGVREAQDLIFRSHRFTETLHDSPPSSPEPEKQQQKQEKQQPPQKQQKQQKQQEQ